LLLLLLLDLHLFRSYSFLRQILYHHKELRLIDIRLYYLDHFERIVLLNSVDLLEYMQVLSWRFDHVEFASLKGSLLPLSLCQVVERRLILLILTRLSFLRSFLLLVHEIFEFFELLRLPIVDDALAI
jgi:hypothetical protein